MVLIYQKTIQETTAAPGIERSLPPSFVRLQLDTDSWRLGNSGAGWALGVHPYHEQFALTLGRGRTWRPIADSTISLRRCDADWISLLDVSWTRAVQPPYPARLVCPREIIVISPGPVAQLFVAICCQGGLTIRMWPPVLERQCNSLLQYSTYLSSNFAPSACLSAPSYQARRSMEDSRGGRRPKEAQESTWKDVRKQQRTARTACQRDRQTVNGTGWSPRLLPTSNRADWKDTKSC